MAISDELNKLIQTKNNLKNAITDKGQEITNEDAFSIYSEKIEAIETKSEVPVIATPDDENPTVIEQNPEAPAQVSTDDTKESINVVVTPQTEMLLGEGSKMEVKVPATSIATAIELNSEQIKADEIVLGVSGKESVVDTSNADATTDNIEENKTAYVDGQKITGSLTHITTVDSEPQSYNVKENPTIVKISAQQFITDKSIIDNSFQVSLSIPKEAFTVGFGISPGKIAVGNTILGIQGTYTGGAEELEQQIKDLQQQVTQLQQEKSELQAKIDKINETALDVLGANNA